MRKFLVFLITLVLSFALVSCKKDDGIVVRFAITSGQIKTAIESLQFEERFEEMNPGINVVIVAIEGSYDDLRKNTMMDINSGSATAPDLVIGYPDHFAEYYGGRALVNLQPYIDHPEYGFTEEELNDFLESYLAENRGYNSERPDDLYGLPFNKSSEVLIYNRTAFELLFEDEWEEKVPQTWDELEQVSLEIIDLVKAGKLDEHWVKETDGKEEGFLKVSDYVQTGKFAPFGYDSSGNAFITLTRQWGGKYTSRDSVAKGYAEFFEDGVAKQMMEDIKALHDAGIFNLAPNFGSNYCSDALKAIQCIMTVGSTAGVRYNESSDYEYDLGVAPIPYKHEDKKYVIQQGTNICMLDVNSTEEELLAAWKFLKFMLSSDNTAAFAIETGGYFPVRKSAFESERYQNYLTNPAEEKKAYSAAARVAQEYYISEYTYFVDPAFIGSSKIRTEVGSLFDDIIANGEDIDARFEELRNDLYAFVIKK